MSILAEIEKIKSCNILKLVFEDKIIGFRVKYYDVNTKSYSYYDFVLETIGVDEDIKHRINRIHKTLEPIQLQRYNGVLISQEELDNNVEIQEVLDSTQAISILKQVLLVKEGV